MSISPSPAHQILVEKYPALKPMIVAVATAIILTASTLLGAR